MNPPTVLVTGGDKGIGSAISRKFCESGYKVIITYNTNIVGANELSSHYKEINAIQCDYSNFETIKNAIETIRVEHNTPNIIVNNIGIDRDSTFRKMSYDIWKNVIDVNLTQMFHFTHAFLDDMIKEKRGRVINISSIGAYSGAFGKTNYAASKSGIIGFTRALALEVAKYGITVNAVCPGAIATEMFYRIPDKYRESLISQIPMQRVGRPEEIADLVYFLSQETASYITGQAIHVNGGQFFNC